MAPGVGMAPGPKQYNTSTEHAGSDASGRVKAAPGRALENSQFGL